MRRNFSLFGLFGFLILNLTLLLSAPTLTHGLQLKEMFDDTKENFKETIQPAKEKYEELPPKGKFGVGALAGYVATKTTVRSTVKAAKYTGAAFIISEVLNQAGVLEKVDIPAGGNEMLQNVKQKVTGAVNDCRLAVRKHCSVDKARNIFQVAIKKDKMGTLGFTTGAVAGLVW
mmetsp:Transcript_2348/g.3496  ORF Transcript_2348/g.3496 Transcript_2348/m.3496 type:complete len:174 (+) Transcript_2348:118-639(+)|eukprot:CAMPEP_0194088212 /NCGR_PEP_ID=MMETSP0149-20130528/28192_1 /TAXON_ID=122233 /ORGANISM="Chaetoceros debilis, Strain MM31A-1" /LENGTH=173 /DNA_ID=CAMNT_0038771805 /DNA_START=41 /DNA_END=562 /DNA_ORIENTATION=+